MQRAGGAARSPGFRRPQEGDMAPETADALRSEEADERPVPLAVASATDDEARAREASSGGTRHARPDGEARRPRAAAQDAGTAPTDFSRARIYPERRSPW